MVFSYDLLINAIISGILIGAFYAAVTAGVSLSFGILDIVNIAHPAFILLGSYTAYIVNATLGDYLIRPQRIRVDATRLMDAATELSRTLCRHVQKRISARSQCRASRIR